jgi:hypothetical protein
MSQQISVNNTTNWADVVKNGSAIVTNNNEDFEKNRVVEVKDTSMFENAEWNKVQTYESAENTKDSVPLVESNTEQTNESLEYPKLVHFIPKPQLDILLQKDPAIKEQLVGTELFDQVSENIESTENRLIETQPEKILAIEPPQEIKDPALGTDNTKDQLIGKDLFDQVSRKIETENQPVSETGDFFLESNQIPSQSLPVATESIPETKETIILELPVTLEIPETINLELPQKSAKDVLIDNAESATGYKIVKDREPTWVLPNEGGILDNLVKVKDAIVESAEKVTGYKLTKDSTIPPEPTILRPDEIAKEVLISAKDAIIDTAEITTGLKLTKDSTIPPEPTTLRPDEIAKEVLISAKDAIIDTTELATGLKLTKDSPDPILRPEEYAQQVREKTLADDL